MHVQAINRTEKTCKRKLMEKMEISLSKDQYYPSKSRMKISLKAADNQKWMPLRNAELNIVSGISISSLKIKSKRFTLHGI